MPTTLPTMEELAALLTRAGFDPEAVEAQMQEALHAAIDAFNTETGRDWGATTETTRYFDRPRSESGLVLFDQELTSLTSVTLGGSPLTRNADFWLLPDNGPQFTGLRLPLTVSAYQPGTALYRALAVTGAWGRQTVPGDVRQAILWLALGELGQVLLTSEQTLGTLPLTEHEEAGVTEKYTDFQGKLSGFSQDKYDRAVARNRRWVPG